MANLKDIVATLAILGSGSLVFTGCDKSDASNPPAGAGEAAPADAEGEEEGEEESEEEGSEDGAEEGAAEESAEEGAAEESAAEEGGGE
ncbi:MAG: hypothetical protein V3V08_11925 [Nannocystaceae bacterium]